MKFKYFKSIVSRQELATTSNVLFVYASSMILFLANNVQSGGVTSVYKNGIKSKNRVHRVDARKISKKFKKLIKIHSIT